MNIDRIQEMKGYLNECTAVTADMNAQLERTDGLRDKMIYLFSYYGSEEWH